MRPLERLEAKLRELLGERDVDGHGLTHALRVRRLARDLALKVGADVEVVEAAALLHDVARALGIEGDHAERSASIALPLMIEAGISEEKAVKAAEIIRRHRYSSRRDVASLEEAVLRDADMLDAMGAIGVARAVAYGALRGRSLYDLEDPFAQRRTPDDSKYTLDHFYVELLRLKELMNTEEGRRRAERRTRFLKLFLEELMLDLEGL